MALNRLLSLTVGAILLNLALTEKFEPEVAFVCDRGAMHMVKGGTWGADPKTDCMEGKSEILAYCKKVYPSLDVTNIVESSEYKHVKGWCALGKKDCGSTEAFKVRPFRCLTGPFQSDALIVPKQCVFEHVHQPKQCHGFDWWSDVAHKDCRGLKHMKTQSFAMLLPCGTDVFTGVEYVCCPDDANSTASATNSSHAVVDTPSISVKIEPSAIAVDASDSATGKLVDKYLHMKENAYKNTEHDAFTHAKKALIKENHAKVTKLMKNWAEARRRVLDMKAIDPKGAEKLNKEISPRFQKEYFALQTSSDSKTLQLDAVHQQHVQANLDVKKRKTIEKMMHEVQSDQPEPRLITKFLKRYISIEEKDAHHCIRHYTKIRDRDASRGQQLLPATLTHLTLISTRINQSITLLNMLDNESVKAKVLTTVEAWRSKTFNNINTYINTFKKELTAHRATKAPRVVEEPKSVEMDKKVESKKPIITVSESRPTKPKKGVYKQLAEKFAAKMQGLKNSKPGKPAVDEENEKENEHDYKDKAKKLRKPLPKPQMNHLAKSSGLSAQSNAAVFGSQATTGSISVGAGVAIAVGVLAGLLVIILSIVLGKKRSRGSKDRYLEVSVDDSLSAEDRHIASMQNGYENPTYKFLEKGGI